MNKCQINIGGMHCRSCEILVEDELKNIKGVRRANVDHKLGLATILFEGELFEDEVKKAIESAGYSFGKSADDHRIIDSDINTYKELGIAAIIVVGLYLFAKGFGFFNLSSGISNNYGSLPVVFLIGITAGVSTCMALVGGLVLGASAQFAKNHPNATGMEKFTPHLYFNLGRIVSYIILGGLIGFLGSVFQLSSPILGLLIVGVGLVMLILGTQLIDIFPFIKNISFTLPKSITRTFNLKDHNPALMGALTFFVPCGFTQAMQLYAMSTGSPMVGAITMGVFALGTAPGLLGVGGLAAIIKGKAARIFFKTAGIVVILLSLFNIRNGFNLLNLNFSPSETSRVVTDTNVKLVNGVQEVRMRQVSSGYIPNKFTIKKGVPVRWIIDSQDRNTCASSIISNSLGIRQILKPGENIIEFNPTQTGDISFSCSMGMYRGDFIVYE